MRAQRAPPRGTPIQLPLPGPLPLHRALKGWSGKLTRPSGPPGQHSSPSPPQPDSTGRPKGTDGLAPGLFLVPPCYIEADDPSARHLGAWNVRGRELTVQQSQLGGPNLQEEECCETGEHHLWPRGDGTCTHEDRGLGLRKEPNLPWELKTWSRT